MAQKPKRAALARQRNRRRQPDRSRSKRSPMPVAATRRAAAATCGWCGGAIDLKATGRIPKWCSAACRQRAWEQTRAAASGRAAVEIVERVVEVRAAREGASRREQWPALLRELTAELDTGRIYARDLPELALALEQVAAAIQRRRSSRRPRR